MAILYVIGNEILNPIVESQVFRPLAAEAPHGGAFVVALLPIGLWARPRHHARVRETLSRLTRQYGVVIFPSYARLSHRASAWIDALVVRRIIRKLLRHHPQLEVRGRNALATVTAIAAARPLEPRPLITYDCRGDEAAELLGRAAVITSPGNTMPPGLARAHQLVTSRMAAACKADAIIVVSGAMGRVLQDRHGPDFSAMTVRPCAVDLSTFPSPNSEQARERLGLGGRFVVCYLGSLEWYQLPGQSIRLFRLIHTRWPDAFFLAVTTSPETMERLLLREGVSPRDFRVVKASPDAVPDYVSAAHLGLLLREDNPVNAVASPVKFAEYLACGVPVVTTNHVGDYSKLVTAQSLGFCVDLDEPDASLAITLDDAVAAARHDKTISSRCRRYAEEHLSWQSVAVTGSWAT